MLRLLPLLPRALLPRIGGGGGAVVGGGGGGFIASSARAAALRACAPLQGTPRYGDAVEFYSWRIEKRMERSLAYRARSARPPACRPPA
jgi:hypothetical protein